LSSYKVPEHIMIFTEADIPITGSGKVKRSELLAKVTALLGE
jgi:acyl-CoA synthetase (AMP-forming)/AMP-acid ligase II